MEAFLDLQDLQSVGCCDYYPTSLILCCNNKVLIFLQNKKHSVLHLWLAESMGEFKRRPEGEWQSGSLRGELQVLFRRPKRILESTFCADVVVVQNHTQDRNLSGKEQKLNEFCRSTGQGPSPRRVAGWTVLSTSNILGKIFFFQLRFFPEVVFEFFAAPSVPSLVIHVVLHR